MNESNSVNQPCLSLEDRRLLFQVAEQSIAAQLSSGRTLELDVTKFPAPLQEMRATFVTLQIAGHLRGCMGSLVARDPLVRDVANNAVSAAFRDPRFSPLTSAEFSRLDFHISVLSPPSPMEVRSEEEWFATVRPGIDGLILYEGRHRATLLPAVWENVADPREFLGHLKRKAGLPLDYWSETIRFERYTAESLEKPRDESVDSLAG